MKKLIFARELLITLIVASLITSVVGIIFVFIALNLGADAEPLMQHQRSFLGTIWGLFVGYKLNTLIRHNKEL